MWREGEIYRARLKSLGWSGAQDSESERSEIDINININIAENKRSSNKSSGIESSFPGDISKITSGLQVLGILSLLFIYSPLIISYYYYFYYFYYFYYYYFFF